ncbi:MAG: NAD-dependent epimerase/dehydratase family protein [Verrucomicrobia bacterium]|nr:NAD-dependent epimerase/dehydratase family protein [Verrucomicrobiota bacterium]
MKKRILVTGGAGFIGSHLTDELLKHGYSVRVLDLLLPQVHGQGNQWPDYLNPEAELYLGDMRDPSAVEGALKGIDAVFHLAAAVGVGQSMYEIAHYTSVNNGGTAILLECLAKRPVERLIVASSMSIYGEGLYQNKAGKLVDVTERTMEQLRARRWELCDLDGSELTPVPTPETKPPALSSVYALSKYDQERMCLIFGKSYNIPTVALRFFNVYGTRQSLSNPYTGVLAIFASRLLNNQPPLINEDGNQKRDFVSVLDVAAAGRLALESPQADGHAINIGSGVAVSVLELAQLLGEMLERKHVGCDVTFRYRKGDIRHCFANVGQAKRLLGYQPKMSLEAGMIDLVEWLEGQTATDHVHRAQEELLARGLAI